MKEGRQERKNKRKMTKTEKRQKDIKKKMEEKA